MNFSGTELSLITSQSSAEPNQLIQSTQYSNESISNASTRQLTIRDQDACQINVIESETNLRYMAICTDATRCGAAVYSDLSIQLVGDRRDSGDPYKGLDLIIQKIEPQIIIVSAVQKKLIVFLEKNFRFEVLDISKKDKIQQRKLAPQCPTSSAKALPTNQQLVTSALDNAQNSENFAEQLSLPEDSDLISLFKLVIVPNNWFSVSKGIQKLLDSDWVKSKGIVGTEGKLFFVQSRVKTNSDICAVRSVSAIDSYIAHSVISKEIETPYAMRAIKSKVLNQLRSFEGSQPVVRQELPQNLMPIIELKYTDPAPVLSLDKSTIEALGIFRSHPRELLVRSNNADADADFNPIPSLFDILNQCQSMQGKRAMRTIMSWPLQDINKLRQRHDTVEYFMKPESKLFLDQIVVQLKNIIPLAGLLTKLSQSVASYKELSKLYKALWSSVAIIDLIKANNNLNVEILQRIINLDIPDLRTSIDSIINIVDFEASKREERIQVCLGVHEGVDEKKQIIKNLVKFCDEVAVEETAKYKNVLDKTCRVVYIPRIGFLNSVDYTAISELQRIKVNREFDVLLHTEQSVYFKTSRMEELDAQAGDIACDLIDIQENVIVTLQNDLLKHTETILRLIELCGELDCLIAFASVSFQRSYTKPEMVSDDLEINIKKAYHPLYCIGYNAVPNDVRFHKEVSERNVKVMVITGPNSCGKTTYMKATCLVVYMAHIGCFVPAAYARLPIIDAIFTRMHCGNSISSGLSSFANDLNQVNYALSRATENSLIAIDEFGKGTKVRDGFHLLKGLLTYFAVRTRSSPYVMVATHFSRIINHLQNYGEHILYKTFKVSRDPAKDTVVYEFQLIDGVCDISFADKVAARAGVPEHIIQRAKQIQEYISEGRPIRALPPSAA